MYGANIQLIIQYCPNSLMILYSFILFYYYLLIFSSISCIILSFRLEFSCTSRLFSSFSCWQSSVLFMVCCWVIVLLTLLCACCTRPSFLNISPLPVRSQSEFTPYSSQKTAIVSADTLLLLFNNSENVERLNDNFSEI